MALVALLTFGPQRLTFEAGMDGEGIRWTFTSRRLRPGRTRSPGWKQADIDAATAQYAACVRDQSSQLVDATTAFVDAYAAGQDARARALYPRRAATGSASSRSRESFGDQLDPRMDLREADPAPGQEWTGSHRIEKDLWPPSTGCTPPTKAERATYGQDLPGGSTRPVLRRLRNPDVQHIPM